MSTGTNKERIEQNNELLNQIKTTINNLPSAGSTSEVKLFETEQAMQADTAAKEGDLATVYRSEIKTISNGDAITSITFPRTVVFTEAITSNYDGRLMNDSEPRIYLDIQLDASRFMLYDMMNTIRAIEYSSTDGITYTRTDSNEDTYKIGETIVEDLDEHICKFMTIESYTFEGLYSYQGYLSNHLVDCAKNISSNSKFEFQSIDLQQLFDFLIEAINNNTLLSPDGLTLYTDSYGYRFLAVINSATSYSLYSAYMKNTTSLDTVYCGLASGPSNEYEWLIKNNSGWGDNGIRVDIDTSAKTMTSTYITDGTETVNTSQAAVIPLAIRDSSVEIMPSLAVAGSYEMKCHFTTLYKYLAAPTQLTTLSDGVYQSIFYGKNGVETGTLTNNVDNSFADINAEIYNKIQKAYATMEPKVLTDTDKTINKNIYFIPVNAQGQPLLDTSKVTNMYGMFENCNNLTTIPLLDTSNAINMGAMFDGCTNLVTISLLNMSKVTKMVNMFRNCTNLKEIPLLNTLHVTSMDNTFTYCKSLATIPLLDTSNVTSTYRMFSNCTNLKEIPLLNTSNVTDTRSMFGNCTSLITIPLLNTSNVTTMFGMFENCTNLATVPLLDTSNVTYMKTMFNGCTSLSDESLNNILAMCTNATKITSDKTLKYIGLTEEQTNKCKTLANYSAFTAAGWTTGY